MTFQQGLAFGLVGLTIGAFIWGRFRYDLVAVVALVAGLAIGIIPAEAAFDGFKNDVTVIIACALIANAASFVLPISNPANLVLYGGTMPPLGQWFG